MLQIETLTHSWKKKQYVFLSRLLNSIFNLFFLFFLFLALPCFTGSRLVKMRIETVKIRLSFGVGGVPPESVFPNERKFLSCFLTATGNTDSVNVKTFMFLYFSEDFAQV